MQVQVIINNLWEIKGTTVNHIYIDKSETETYIEGSMKSIDTCDK